MNWITVALISVGLFFLVVGSIGMLRLPDVFTRSHALSLTDSLGALFVLGGLAVHQGPGASLLKILLVLLLIYLLNPVVSHATIRAAYRAGLRPDAGDRDDP
ncbi:MAG: monovalent cation/H(+) antiporter subunit G [Halieaceae bacterium]|jgi:multicomponent Na+:H+ antiporter subunit G|nr:monovalent cation/H(+) antiporter subunit G [Halieaceae bacterium]